MVLAFVLILNILNSMRVFFKDRISEVYEKNKNSEVYCIQHNSEY